MNSANPIRAIIVGRTGRMGVEIENIAKQSGLISIVGGVGREAGGLEACFADLEKSSVGFDVVIDFSLPVATVAVAKACAKRKTPLVSGVTGLTSIEHQALSDAGKVIPVLYSANMSLGIQVLAKALESLKGIEGFDISIEETHHRHKRDRPSGTALLLDDELLKRTGRRAGEIVSLRGGGVIGDHRVMAFSDSEVLTFGHQALNRAVFARGACRAARWIVGKKPGSYTLADTLG